MEECPKARAGDQNQIKSSNDANCISRFGSFWPLTQHNRFLSDRTWPLWFCQTPQARLGRTRKATWDQKMASHVSCIAHNYNHHFELFNSLSLNSSKWFYWIGCLFAAHRSLNVCVNFSFFVVFVRKLLVGFLLLFFLQKSLASIGWLILSFLFIFFDQVGGWSSCSFSKARGGGGLFAIDILCVAWIII